jgi:BirA family biotin operon repressor/biotin-[acetyl-CoA-carboxylase] ligase
MNDATPPGWRLQLHDALRSTQDTAIAAACAGGADHLAVFAREQSAGRGSKGRQWAAPPGNLNLSLVLEDGAGRMPAGLWSLLAGVVLHAAVAALVGEADGLRLKWPNDLMLGRAKLGGILIDTAAGNRGGLDWVVIGIGVNLDSAPEIPGRETACLGPGVSPERLAIAILREIDLWRDRDSQYICRAWLERAHPVGTKLRIVSPEGTRIGAFAGLSRSGGLLLENDIRPIVSAEITLQDEAPESPCPSPPGLEPGPYSLTPCC